jgi:hypothetical protein
VHARHRSGAFQIGDEVRILATAATAAAGFADRSGTVYGVTTVSLWDVYGWDRGPLEVVGVPQDDFAVNVSFGDEEEGVWFATDLIELLERGPGCPIDMATLRGIVDRYERRWWRRLGRLLRNRHR